MSSRRNRPRPPHPPRPDWPRTAGAERDAKQLNRYRLVVASDHPIQLLTDARTSFESVVGDDNRAHLHIVATDQLPDVLRVDLNGEAGAI